MQGIVKTFSQIIIISAICGLFLFLQQNYLIISLPDKMQPYIEQHSKTVESRTKFVKSLYVKLKQGNQTTDKDQIIIIETYSTLKNTGIEVVVRKVSELDYLQHHLYNNYGGHIIPYIHSDLYFQRDSEPQQLVQLVQEYLNDLCNDYYCAGDEKVFNFFFNQEIFSPQQQTYDKVLSKAAIYSRRYLNSIFARKQINQISNPMAGQFVQIYKSFCFFSTNFKEFRKIVLNYDQQQELTQDIFSLVSQLSGQLSVATIPVQYLNTKTKNKINRIYKMVLQGQEAFKRWEMLNQTVRQLQGNVRKGLHEQHKALHDKQKQLQKWTKSLGYQYKQIIQSAQKVMQKIAEDYLTKKKEQFQSLCQILKHRVYVKDQMPKKSEKQTISQSYSPQQQQSSFKKQEKQINQFKKQVSQNIQQNNFKAKKEQNTFQTSEIQKCQNQKEQQQELPEQKTAQNVTQENLTKKEDIQEIQQVLNIKIQQKIQQQQETTDQRQCIDQREENQIIDKQQPKIDNQAKVNSSQEIQNGQNKQILTQ